MDAPSRGMSWSPSSSATALPLGGPEYPQTKAG